MGAFQESIVHKNWTLLENYLLRDFLPNEERMD